MTTNIPEENQEESADYDIDWDDRVLCDDGNCIGVIGADGRCRECGRAHEGDLPEPAVSDQDERPEAEDEEPSIAVVEPDHAPQDAADDDWDHRVLCSDGNCIGIIGSDGKCKECGKPLE